MTNFKGTKGKWNIEKTPPYFEPKCSTTEIHSDLDSGWICKIQDNGVIEFNEGQANALLISKAPEMLKMLVLIRDSGLIDGYFDLFDSVKCLIKSATTL